MKLQDVRKGEDNRTGKVLFFISQKGVIKVKVVIAEKPSVAKSYATVLHAGDRKDGYYEGSGYIVTWCVGHLVELAQPAAYNEEYKKWDIANLPILPEKWKYEIKAATAKQFNIVKKLINDADVTEVVCGTDAGREGELIFRHVYKMSGCKKPIKRLWVSSMEESALKEGFSHLRDGEEYQNLYYAALFRERADWLVGMNFSPLFSLIYSNGAAFSVGRVQTPTLALICERDAAIENHVKTKFYVAHIKNDKFHAVSEHIENEEAAKKIQEACNGADAKITEMKRDIKSVGVPLLYDLTTLQRDANRMFGYTADFTLKIIQILYEKKLVTYPRTDSQYLTEDMEGTAMAVAGKITERYGIKTDVILNKKIFNNTKVTDHHAIIPTIQDADMSALPAEEQTIYALISMRLLCALSTPYRYESTVVKLDCCGYVFKASGNITADVGYKHIEELFKKKLKAEADTEKKSAESNINPDAELKEGMIFDVEAYLSEDYTKPLPHYTEDTLLSAMEKAGAKDMSDDVERKGMGTPATRAEIIEKLVKRGYVKREKKKLISTEKGRYIISVVPEKIKSAAFTADMENELVKVATGQRPYKNIMDEFLGYIKEVINEFSTKDVSIENKFINTSSESDENVLCKCPRCKSDIKEGKTNYYCTNRECKVVLFKDNKYLESMKKKLTKKIAKDFFTRGSSDIKGLVSSKSGNTFNATIKCTFDEKTGYAKFNMKF